MSAFLRQLCGCHLTTIIVLGSQTSSTDPPMFNEPISKTFVSLLQLHPWSCLKYINKLIFIKTFISLLQLHPWRCLERVNKSVFLAVSVALLTPSLLFMLSIPKAYR